MNNIIHTIYNTIDTVFDNIYNIYNSYSEKNNNHCRECDDCYLYIYERGLYYGYPRCCIESFIQKLCGGFISDRQYTVAKHRFIPCRYHTIQIEKNLITINDLISPERKEKTLFTESDNVI